MNVSSDHHASSTDRRQGDASAGSDAGRWFHRPDGTGVRRQRPPKLYRIGELVEYYGLSRQTIHNYTTMGLLRESDRTRAGHRLYDESVFDRLDAIARMKEEHRSLGFIREYFAQAEDEGHEREPVGTS
ncbi:MAG: MerR family transcriptional regulator [Phycisphaerae bacterium]|nr:MerR family transcriptional regulator [Phycisphaerae bacterium]